MFMLGTTLPVSAQEPTIPSSEETTIILIDDNGVSQEFSLSEGETIELPIYASSENGEKNSRFSIPTATLVIYRAYGQLIWNFNAAPWVPLSLGFTGSVSVTNAQGLSGGTTYYRNAHSGMLGSSTTGYIIFSGIYEAVGYSPAIVNALFHI